MDKYVKVKKSDLESIANVFRMRMGTSSRITFPGGFREAAGWLPSNYPQLNAPELILDDGVYKVIDEINSGFTEHYLLIAKNQRTGSEEIITINMSTSREVVINDEMLDKLLLENGIIYELSVTAWAAEFKTSDKSNKALCTAYSATVNVSNGNYDCSFNRIYSNRAGWSFKIIPNTNYLCPEKIKITMGGAEISSYVWNQTTGEVILLSIPTGNINITVECVAKELFAYAMLSDGTYEVSLADGVVPEEPLVIPSEHEGITVTAIGEFKTNSIVPKITIPSSIRIFNKLFSGYDALTEIELLGDCGWKCTCADGTHLNINPSMISMDDLVSYFKRDDLVLIEARPIYSITVKVVNGTHDNMISWILGESEDVVFSVTPSLGYKIPYISETYWELNGSLVTIKASSIPKSSTNGIINIVIPMEHEHFSFSQQYSSAWISGRDADTIPEELLIPSYHDFGSGPTAVSYIMSNGFENFDRIKKIDFVSPSNIISLGFNALAGCSNLTKINLPNSLEKIGSNAFRNDNSLETILIPESVKYCEANAFLGCPNMCIYLQSSSIPDDWNENFNPDMLKVVCGYSSPYPLAVFIDNGNIEGSLPTTIAYDEKVEFRITPDPNRGYPAESSLIVFGCEYTYNKSRGTVVLYKPHGSVSVEIVCPEAEYSFNVVVSTDFEYRQPVAIIKTMYSNTIRPSENKIISVLPTVLPNKSEQYILGAYVSNAEVTKISEDGLVQKFKVYNATGNVTMYIKGHRLLLWE